MVDLSDRGQFLNLSGLFEGGLIVLAFVLGWIFDVNPIEHLTFTWSAVLWGIAAALPMFGLFVLAHRFSFGPLKQIRRFLIEMLGPSLAACRWYDLILLAGLAGITEEVLFRGMLQMWIERACDSPTAGLVVASILFALAHLITPFYALFAGVMGLYLGCLLDVSGQRNLLVPVITHAVYDYLAFLIVLRTYHHQQAQPSEADAADADNDSPSVM
jgi:hypothetical protein